MAVLAVVEIDQNKYGFETENSLVMNWNKVQATVLAVDMRDEFAYLPLEFWRVRESRGCHLDQNNFANPLWEILQELLKSSELAN